MECIWGETFYLIRFSQRAKWPRFTLEHADTPRILRTFQWMRGSEHEKEKNVHVIYMLEFGGCLPIYLDIIWVHCIKRVVFPSEKQTKIVYFLPFHFKGHNFTSHFFSSGKRKWIVIIVLVNSFGAGIFHLSNKKPQSNGRVVDTIIVIRLVWYRVCCVCVCFLFGVLYSHKNHKISPQNSGYEIKLEKFFWWCHNDAIKWHLTVRVETLNTHFSWHRPK